jgi:hypothetical protein
MGIRRILCALVSVALLVACGDPSSVGSDPSTQVAAPTDSVRLCTDAPFIGSPGNQPPEDAVSAVTQWVDMHPELFAGMWWDSRAGEFVFTTIDIDESSTLIEQELPGDLSYRIESVARSASQLGLLQQRVPTLAEDGIEAGSGIRVWDALVEIDLPILDEPSLAVVRRVFEDDLDAICVTGADPATVPPDGPQPTSGSGWRLLADQLQRGVPYSVDAAVNAAEYESLWASLALDGDRPPVDFATEIVIHFGAVYSGSCPEIRLDGVTFDLDRSLVTAAVVQLGGNRACTADANSRAYLVAVDKAQLPPLPFTVSLQPDCAYCAHGEISTFEGTDSPAATLSEFDRSQILSAALVYRLGADGAYETVDIAEVVGHATDDGLVDLDGGTALTEGERNTIVQVLGSRSVRFVPVPEFEQLVPAPERVVLSVAEPVVRDGRLTITTALGCGPLCGSGGATAVEKLDDGTWTLTDMVGPQWNA